MLAISAVLLSIAGKVPGIGGVVSSMLALVPQSTIGSMYVWNVFTAGFFEAQPAAALLTIPSLALAGRWIEPVWGGKELAFFSVLVNTFAGIFSFVVSMVAYFVTRSQVYMYVYGLPLISHALPSPPESLMLSANRMLVPPRSAIRSLLTRLSAFNLI